MDGDRPISATQDDRLGLAHVADYLARTLTIQHAASGLVIGIEGKWGSGKSTLINLTIDALKKQEPLCPEVVTFAPWLVGDRDELLRTLVDELVAAAVRIDPIEAAIDAEDASLGRWKKLQRSITPSRHWRVKQKERLRKQAAGKLKAFGQMAGTVGKFAKASGDWGVPGGAAIGAALERGGDAAGALFGAGSLSKRKSELVDVLKLLSRPIVVFVDDLDRLEPREASEVLRLIRAVADFPNVIYVLSYDPDIVAQTLTKSIQVEDGHAFLDKIVQVSFKVPEPEAFDLRRWFFDEVGKLFRQDLEDNGTGNGNELTRRLAYAVDVEGGRYLATPRHVVRALNALRLHAVPVRERIDVADAVWLHLVRIGNPELYRWIERYLVEVAAISNGALLSRGDDLKMESELAEILKAEQRKLDEALIELRSMLPGLDYMNIGHGAEKKSRLFKNLSHDQLHPFVRQRRLGSPQHYRLYFAFGESAGALKDAEVQSFINQLSTDLSAARGTFAAFVAVKRPQGGTQAEVLIDRLLAVKESIPIAAIDPLFQVLADGLDSAVPDRAKEDWGADKIWWLGERAVKTFLKKVPDGERRTVIEKLFRDGQSLGWLTDMLRDEIFAHGKYGDRPKHESEWLLSTTEFEAVLAIMLARYKALPLNAASTLPSFMNILYAWNQGGDAAEVRAAVSSQCRDDEGLIAFLEKARGRSTSGHRSWYTLKKTNLADFLDVDEAERRVRNLASSETATAEMRKRAAELITAFDAGRDDARW